MKNCFLLVKTLVVAAVLLIASKSQALHTGYMINASNGLAFYAQTLTDPADAAKAKALSRSLRTLSKPSASTAQDYKLYFSATLQLGQFAFTDPVLNEAGTQLFMAFMMDANVQIQETAARIEALNQFVRTKKSASNNLAQAAALLNANMGETNVTVALLRGLRLFSKLTTAQRLTTIGENNQGNAPGTLIGGTFRFSERNEVGRIEFHESVAVLFDGDSEEGEEMNYEYDRTGLHTGTITLTSGERVITVKATFREELTGRFTYKDEGGEETSKGAGLFELTFPLR